MIDLHTHSTASDGTFTPREVVELAVKNKLTTLALTDHDTVAGIAEAKTAAMEAGLNFIAGIEFNIEVPFGEFHLLGYDMDIHNKDFVALLADCTKRRDARNRQLCEMLTNRGIIITKDMLHERFSGQIGRPHFAMLLKELGFVRSVQEAFDKLLAFGCPFYLKTKGQDFEKVLSIIHNAGGLAVLAHPMSLYLSWKNLQKKIIELQEAGLDGIEAWNAGTKPQHCRRLELFAKSRNLVITAGSDFHGKNKPRNPMGRKSTGGEIEDWYYNEQLRPALDKRSKTPKNGN